MKNITTFTILILWSIAALSEGVLITEYNPSDSAGEQFLELVVVPDEGIPFNEAIDSIAFDEGPISIRVLQPLTELSRKEVIYYYETHTPEELKLALSSKGNLHNPALEPLSEQFAVAFRSTTQFLEMESKLLKAGYKVVQFSFEKFTLYEGRLFVAEIWLGLQENA